MLPEKGEGENPTNIVLYCFAKFAAINGNPINNKMLKHFIVAKKPLEHWNKSQLRAKRRR